MAFERVISIATHERPGADASLAGRAPTGDSERAVGMETPRASLKLQEDPAPHLLALLLGARTNPARRAPRLATDSAGPSSEAQVTDLQSGVCELLTEVKDGSEDPVSSPCEEAPARATGLIQEPR